MLFSFLLFFAYSLCYQITTPRIDTPTNEFIQSISNSATPHFSSHIYFSKVSLPIPLFFSLSSCTMCIIPYGKNSFFLKDDLFRYSYPPRFSVSRHVLFCFSFTFVLAFHSNMTLRCSVFNASLTLSSHHTALVIRSERSVLDTNFLCSRLY